MVSFGALHSGWYFSTVQLPISHTKTGALRPLELAGGRVAPNFVAFNRVAFWRYANKIKTGWLNIYMLLRAGNLYDFLPSCYIPSHFVSRWAISLCLVTHPPTPSDACPSETASVVLGS